MATVTFLRDDILHAQGTDYIGQDVDEHEFELDGTKYLIDLNEENWEALKAALADFVAAARKTGARRGRPRGSATAATSVSTATPAAVKPKVDREQSKAIREWARGLGYTMSDRGRIPVPILDAYHANDPDTVRQLAAEQQERIAAQVPQTTTDAVTPDLAGV